jgi:hypothetical protein
LGRRHFPFADRLLQQTTAHRQSPFSFNSKKKVKSACASGMKEHASGRRHREVIGSERSSNKNLYVTQHTNVILVCKRV